MRPMTTVPEAPLPAPSAPSRPTLVVGGDPRHGVVRLARDLAAEIEALSGVGSAREDPPAQGAAHVHFTDRLWGSSPEAAGGRIRELGARLALTVTLHDVPQRSDGEPVMRRRIACYRAVVGAARGVVCNSVHEVRLLRECGALGRDAPDPEVIPLPVVRPLAAGRARPAPRPEIAVLGHIYPGKGHAQAILAAAELAATGPRLSVTALGGPASGHAGEVRELTALAARHDVTFEATGWLSDGDLTERCREAGVGLAAHTHVSASASILSWIAAGRRPLVADSRYAREIASLRPRTLNRYRPTDLPTAVAAALADPASTWQDDEADTRPHLKDAARAYLAWWNGR